MGYSANTTCHPAVASSKHCELLGRAMDLKCLMWFIHDPLFSVTDVPYIGSICRVCIDQLLVPPGSRAPAASAF